jgi:heme exporter protein D
MNNWAWVLDVTQLLMLVWLAFVLRRVILRAEADRKTREEALADLRDTATELAAKVEKNNERMTTISRYSRMNPD